MINVGSPPSRRGVLRAARGLSLALLPVASTGSNKRQGDDAQARPPQVRPGTLADFIDARHFGARFDSAHDDAPALQAAIDRAHVERRPLQLPGGTAMLGSPLDLRRREVRLLGAGFDATVLRALRPLPTLLNAAEDRDKINSPLIVQGLTLDGAGITQRNLALRYRHQSVLSDINSIQADVAYWEQDAWLSRRFGCRAGDARIGWHLVGANHSSLWQGCSMTACRDTHLLIGDGGTARDGNQALLFRSCDVEFGKGVGIDVAGNVGASFESCYVGEAIEGDVVRNRGTLMFRDGTFFFGAGAGAVGVRPLGGQATFDGVTVESQGPGLAALANLTPNEAAAPGGIGRVAFDRMIANLPVGGAPLLHGDILGRVQMRTYAPRLGRDWVSWGRGATIADERAPAGSADGRSVSCRGVNGAGAIIAQTATLTAERWRESVPIFLACVYSATRAVQVRLSPGLGREPAQVLTQLPAALGISTYLEVQTIAPASGFSVIELVMLSPQPGDRLVLSELTLADGVAVRATVAGGGNLATLGLAR